MKLHTAEINYLNNRLAELGGANAGTLHLQRKLDTLMKQDEETIESLVPSAIKLINYRFNGISARIVYKSTGTRVHIITNRDRSRYNLYSSTGKRLMVFTDIESLARFLIMSEDLLFESSMEREEI